MAKFGELFFGLILVFFGWIFLAGSSSQKLDRACRPVSWMGNIFTSMAEISFPTTSYGVQDWFARLDYGCQYSLWRLFYEDDYKARLRAQGKPVPGSERKQPGPPAAPKRRDPSAPVPPENSGDEEQYSTLFGPPEESGSDQYGDPEDDRD